MVTGAVVPNTARLTFKARPSTSAADRASLGARATVMEPQTGAGHEIAHRAGDENLAGAGKCSDARCGVYGDATDILPADLNLASMEATAHLDAEGA